MVVDLKTEMSDQEWKVVNEYLRQMAAGNPEALLAALYTAGYDQLVMASEVEARDVGQLILKKWQDRVDHKEVMKSVGLGPELVSRHLLQIIKSSPFDTCRVQALGIASKCLDMQKATIDAGQGTELVIRRSKGSGLDEPETYEHEMGASPVTEDRKPARKHRVRLGVTADTGHLSTKTKH